MNSGYHEETAEIAHRETTKTMPRYSEFVVFVIEQMSFIEGLRVRAMFGGHGVYRDDCIFAIIADDRLYFKNRRHHAWCI